VIGNPEWDNAMDEEMATLDVNVVWELVALLKDNKTIRCKCTKSNIMQKDL
jgi:hypothetical protein